MTQITEIIIGNTSLNLSRICLFATLSTIPWLTSFALLTYLNEKKVITLNKSNVDKAAITIHPLILFTYFSTSFLTLGGAASILPLMLNQIARTVIMYGNGIISGNRLSFGEAFRICDELYYSPVVDSVFEKVLWPCLSIFFHITEGPTAKLLNGFAERNKEAILIGSALVTAQILGYMAIQYAFCREKEEHLNI